MPLFLAAPAVSYVTPLLITAGAFTLGYIWRTGSNQTDANLKKEKFKQKLQEESAAQRKGRDGALKDLAAGINQFISTTATNTANQRALITSSTEVLGQNAQTHEATTARLIAITQLINEASASLDPNVKPLLAELKRQLDEFHPVLAGLKTQENLLATIVRQLGELMTRLIRDVEESEAKPELDSQSFANINQKLQAENQVLRSENREFHDTMLKSNPILVMLINEVAKLRAENAKLSNIIQSQAAASNHELDTETKSTSRPTPTMF